MPVHEKYMKRCLELAAKGFGKVAPNPMAGCVIVHNNKVVGEGYHKKFGTAHAEVNAINSVKDKSLLRNSTLYVNLEPCSHFGKTPPCADLIIRYKIKYVVIGSLDSNPIVRGKGIHKLATSGCDVKVGVLEDRCRELNRRFFTWHEKRRPYVILKWAQTKDGFIGAEGVRLKVSGVAAKTLVHKWRSEEQAIMVGTKTALNDNPKLTVRNIKGKNPIRIVIDRLLKIPRSYHLLDGSVPTLVFTSKSKKQGKNVEYIRMDFEKDVLNQVLNRLHERNIQSVMVEGGEKLLTTFIQKNYWDEARVITSIKTLSNRAVRRTPFEGVKAPQIGGKLILKKRVGKDGLAIIRNTYRSS